jgi:hypothetical protein
VPAGLHLELLVPLYLIGAIMPSLRLRATRWAGLISGAVAAACLAVPMHLGVAIGIVAGLVAGSLIPAAPAPSTRGAAS